MYSFNDNLFFTSEGSAFLYLHVSVNNHQHNNYCDKFVKKINSVILNKYQIS